MIEADRQGEIDHPRSVSRIDPVNIAISVFHFPSRDFVIELKWKIPEPISAIKPNSNPNNENKLFFSPLGIREFTLSEPRGIFFRIQKKYQRQPPANQPLFIYS